MDFEPDALGAGNDEDACRAVSLARRSWTTNVTTPETTTRRRRPIPRWLARGLVAAAAAMLAMTAFTFLWVADIRPPELRGGITAEAEARGRALLAQLERNHGGEAWRLCWLQTPSAAILAGTGDVLPSAGPRGVTIGVKTALACSDYPGLPGLSGLFCKSRCVRHFGPISSPLNDLAI